MARPHGEIALALLAAAAAGPGTVRQLCERAQVGRRVGQYTGCRLVASGHLVEIEKTRLRRRGRLAAVLALPTTTCTYDAAPGADLAAALAGWR